MLNSQSGSFSHGALSHGLGCRVAGEALVEPRVLDERHVQQQAAEGERRRLEPKTQLVLGQAPGLADENRTVEVEHLGQGGSLVGCPVQPGKRRRFDHYQTICDR